MMKNTQRKNRKRVVKEVKDIKEKKRGERKYRMAGGNLFPEEKTSIPEVASDSKNVIKSSIELLYNIPELINHIYEENKKGKSVGIYDTVILMGASILLGGFDDYDYSKYFQMVNKIIEKFSKDNTTPAPSDIIIVYTDKTFGKSEYARSIKGLKIAFSQENPNEQKSDFLSYIYKTEDGKYFTHDPKKEDKDNGTLVIRLSKPPDENVGTINEEIKTVFKNCVCDIRTFCKEYLNCDVHTSSSSSSSTPSVLTSSPSTPNPVEEKYDDPEEAAAAAAAAAASAAAEAERVRLEEEAAKAAAAEAERVRLEREAAAAAAASAEAQQRREQEAERVRLEQEAAAEAAKKAEEEASSSSSSSELRQPIKLPECPAIDPQNAIKASLELLLNIPELFNEVYDGLINRKNRSDMWDTLLLYILTLGQKNKKAEERYCRLIKKLSAIKKISEANKKQPISIILFNIYNNGNNGNPNFNGKYKIFEFKDFKQEEEEELNYQIISEIHFQSNRYFTISGQQFEKRSSSSSDHPPIVVLLKRTDHKQAEINKNIYNFFNKCNKSEDKDCTPLPTDRQIPTQRKMCWEYACEGGDVAEAEKQQIAAQVEEQRPAAQVEVEEQRLAAEVEEQRQKQYIKNPPLIRFYCIKVKECYNEFKKEYLDLLSPIYDSFGGKVHYIYYLTTQNTKKNIDLVLKLKDTKILLNREDEKEMMETILLNYNSERHKDGIIVILFIPYLDELLPDLGGAGSIFLIENQGDLWGGPVPVFKNYFDIQQLCE